jgi:hypothetical protein
MSTRRIVYFSKSLGDGSDRDIADILDVARGRNAKEGITGLLLHIDGVYAQVLEGPAEAVSRVMESIESDRRHSDMVIVSDDMVDQRRFNDWSMAFLNADSSDLLEAAGFGGLEDAISTMSSVGAVPKHVIEAALERFSRRLDTDSAVSA